jgi:AmiR/NasT family two-component response regulator
MKRARLDEQAAFQRMQKLSMDKGRKLIEIARTIVEADEAFQEPA